MSKELTNKLRTFFTNYAKDAEEYYVDGYYEGGDAPILQALEDFGKQCFIAGAKLGYQNGVKSTCFVENEKLPYCNYDTYLENLETK